MSRRGVGWAVGLALLLALTAGCGARTELSTGGDAGTARPETCDGRDDDGDGRIDEGIAEQRCGVGACEAVAPGCVDGRVPACVPGPVQREVCGGGDQDCDGRVDEGLRFGPLSDPVVVSAPGVELGPFNQALVPTDAGLLSIFRVSFDGSRPTPNLLSVPLDENARPTRDRVAILERSVTNGPRAAAGPDGDIALAYCGRSGGEDVTFAALTDEQGRAPASDVVREGVDLACGASDPDVVWTGERYLVAWVDNRSTSAEGVDHSVQLDATDRALTSQRTAHLTAAPFEGDLGAPPRFGTNGDVTLLAWGVRSSEELTRSVLHLLALDPRGEPLGPRVSAGEAPPLPGADRADWGTMFIAPRRDGFRVFAEDRRSGGGGVLMLDVSRRGEPVRAARRLEGFEGRAPELQGAVGADGEVFLTTASGETAWLLRVDAEGSLVESLRVEGPEEGDIAWPIVATRGDRVYVSWTRLRRGVESTLRARVFGCLP